MKKSTFVSFSSMLQKKSQAQQSPPTPVEPEVDYEKLYLELMNETDQLKKQVVEIQQLHEQEKKTWEKQNSDHIKFLGMCEQQVSVWKDELKENLHNVWNSFLQLCAPFCKFEGPTNLVPAFYCRCSNPGSSIAQKR